MDYIWVGIVVASFLILSFSWTCKEVPKNLWQVVLRTTRYAVFFSPAIAGGEGFGLPAPFILAAPINATLPHSLPILVLTPFAVTWLVIFFYQYARHRSSAR
jgi:hypothetical protein